MTMRKHDLVTYLFAGCGLYLAFLHPVEGVALTLGVLLSGAFHDFVRRVDTREAAEVVAGLQHVVNENARRLELVIQDVEKLNAQNAFAVNAKGMGLR